MCRLLLRRNNGDLSLRAVRLRAQAAGKARIILIIHIINTKQKRLTSCKVIYTCAPAWIVSPTLSRR